MENPLPALPGRPSSATSEAKRAAILEAGAEVFLARGFGNANMDEIARRAGVSKATVYSHFNSKHGLFGAIVQARCQRMMGAAWSTADDRSPPEAMLQRIGRAFLDLLFAAGSLQLYRVVVAEAERSPELGQVFFRIGPDEGAGTLAAYLTEIDRRGILRVPDARLAAEQFFGMVLGHLHLKLLLGVMAQPPEGETRDRLVARAVEVFVAGHRPG